MQPKISVIIPVYKVEPYLNQCVDSVLAQTYENLEVILVDDGSPDNCGAICDEYAKKDRRVKVIHKENGGLSSARNAGIDIATGEYLNFIDSDDWVESDMLELLYNNLVKCDADISCCDFYMAYANKNEPLSFAVGNLAFNSEQAVERVLKMKFPPSAWAKLYKRHIFDDIRYPVGKYCEDNFIIIDILSKANIIVGDPAFKYYYRQRKNSIMRNIDRISDNMEALNKVFETAKEKYPDIADTAKSFLPRMNLYILNQIIFVKHYAKLPEYKRVLSEILKFKSDVLSKNEKLKVRAIKINIKLYKLLQSFSDRIKSMKHKKVLFE